MGASSSLVRFENKQIYLDKNKNVMKIVNLMVDVIILLTMFLCFFALSANMSANLYD